MDTKERERLYAELIAGTQTPVATSQRSEFALILWINTEYAFKGPATGGHPERVPCPAGAVADLWPHASRPAERGARRLC